MPSCGKQAVDYLDSLSNVEISYGEKIRVNGKEWSFVETREKLTVIVDRDALKPLAVAIVFGATGKTSTGLLSVLGFEAEQPRCGDSVNLEGKYRP